MHIANILKEDELQKDSVIKNYLTTATRWHEKRKPPEIQDGSSIGAIIRF